MKDFLGPDEQQREIGKMRREQLMRKIRSFLRRIMLKFLYVCPALADTLLGIMTDPKKKD